MVATHAAAKRGQEGGRLFMATQQKEDSTEGLFKVQRGARAKGDLGSLPSYVLINQDWIPIGIGDHEARWSSRILIGFVLEFHA